MLKAVDEGQAKLHYLVFDEIAFTDAVITEAPPWSWDWYQGNRGFYHDPKVARYRKALKYPPISDD